MDLSSGWLGFPRDPRMGSAVLWSDLAATAISPMVLSLSLGRFGVDASFPLITTVASTVTMAFVPVSLWARGRDRSGLRLA